MEGSSNGGARLHGEMSLSASTFNSRIRSSVAQKRLLSARTVLENRKNLYFGEMSNNKRDGFGYYVYENPYFQYEGEWKDGEKHGKSQKQEQELYC